MNQPSDPHILESNEAGLPAAADANELIAAHGGDARAVIIKLLVQVAVLKRENQHLTGAVSRGFIRAPWSSGPW